MLFICQLHAAKDDFHSCFRCILSKCYSAALPVLDQDVDDVDPKRTAMTARDFLLYAYYGGLIYTGQDTTSWEEGIRHSFKLSAKLMSSMVDVCDVVDRPQGLQQSAEDVSVCPHGSDNGGECNHDDRPQEICAGLAHTHWCVHNALHRPRSTVHEGIILCVQTDLQQWSPTQQ